MDISRRCGRAFRCGPAIHLMRRSALAVDRRLPGQRLAHHSLDPYRRPCRCAVPLRFRGVPVGVLISHAISGAAASSTQSASGPGTAAHVASHLAGVERLLIRTYARAPQAAWDSRFRRRGAGHDRSPSRARRRSHRPRHAVARPADSKTMDAHHAVRRHGSRSSKASSSTPCRPATTSSSPLPSRLPGSTPRRCAPFSGTCHHEPHSRRHRSPRPRRPARSAARAFRRA